MLKGMIVCTGLVAMAAGTSAQISTNSIDSFDSDNEGWRVGNAGTAPTFESGNSFDGQPGFLRHFSDGGGANGKFLMWTEQSDWTGDYAAAGVTGISLWADGISGDDLVFWLGFDGPGGWHFTPGQTIVTTDGWTKFDFSIAADDLIYQANSGGSGVAADTLADVTRFEIFAGPGPVAFAGRGDLLRAGTSNNVVTFDNITAVPEPGTAALFVAAPFLLRRLRRQTATS